MAIEFCHACSSVTQCRVISGGRHYLEKPYMNAYVRTRKCDDCGGEFETYEIGASSFNGLRKILTQSKNLANLIDNTWADTKDEFHKDSVALNKLDQKDP
ncbi:hypothetical protein OAB00_03280 [Akkermansiaceae bacterium]|nr:hypothetical protein [Akkermansiaceae bacterium]